MRKSAVAILIMGICLFSLNAEAQYDLAKYFPLDQDNRWVYLIKSDGEEEATLTETVAIKGVEKIDGRETIKMFTDTEEAEGEKDEGYFCIGMDSGGVKAYKYVGDDGYTIYEPPLLLFPTQLKIGNTLEFSNSLTEYYYDAAPARASNVRKITLENLEDITIKSREFKDCLKFSIREETNYNNGEFDFSNWTIWLAPNIGKVKEIKFSTAFNIDEGVVKETNELELKSAVIRGKNFGE